MPRGIPGMASRNSPLTGTSLGPWMASLLKLYRYQDIYGLPIRKPPRHPPPLALTRMSLLSRRKRGVTAGVRVVLQAIKDTGDVFPPVKSAAAAVIVVWEMSRVSTKVCIFLRAPHDCFMLQRTRSNRKDCEHLADRAAEIVQCIWAQTKHYRRGDLSVEVEQSINRIARSVSIYGLHLTVLSWWHHRIFEDVVVFLNELSKQSLANRFARQDENKKKIERFGKSLEEAMQDFSVRPAAPAPSIFLITCLYYRSICK